MSLQWSDRTDGMFTWDDANGYVERLNRENHGGYSDWRLPTTRELLSLVDFEKVDPASSGDSMMNRCCWSSTIKIGNSSHAWYVDFYYGCEAYELKRNLCSVRVVRTREIVL